jgi:hypothetical protein
MPRTTLLLTMIALVVASVLGMGGWWLGRVPALPIGHDRIAPGMTLGQIEHLLGREFTVQESCTRGAYYLLIDDPLAGQLTCIYLGTRRHRRNPTNDVVETLTRNDQPCFEVLTYRWSRIEWLNDHAWSRRLLGLPLDD